MEGRADVNAKAPRAAPNEVEVLVQLKQHGVQKDRQRAKNHHRRHGHRDLLGTALDDGLGGHHRRRAANRAARANQHDRLAIHAQPARADPVGQRKGRAQHQRINHHTGQPDLADILHRQAQAIQHHAQAQQRLFGKIHARPAGGGKAWVNGVAHQHAQHDGQRQCAQSVVLQPADAAQRHGSTRQRRAQRQAGQHALQPGQLGRRGVAFRLGLAGQGMTGGAHNSFLGAAGIKQGSSRL